MSAAPSAMQKQGRRLDDALAASDRPDELLMGLRGIRGSADRTVGGGPGPDPAGPAGSGLRLAQ